MNLKQIHHHVRSRRTVSMLLLGALILASCGDDEADVVAEAETDGEAEVEDAIGDDECAIDGDAAGVDDEVIRIGNTNILSGPIAFIGEDANEAFMVPIERLNEEGGVHGRQIEFVSYDDAYTTSMALEGARRLVEQDEIFAWTGGIGTPTYLSVVSFLEQANVPGISPFAPARSMGTMQHPLTFMTWPDFTVEYRTLAEYLIENEDMAVDGTTVALVRFNTDHGADALEGTEQALEEAGVEDSLVLVVETTTDETDFGPIALDVANSGADWLAIQLSSEQGGQLLQALADLGHRPRVFAQGDYSDESFIENFPEVAEGLYPALQVAIFEDPPNPELQQHMDDLRDATGSEMTTWRAIGYQQGLLTAEALRRMAGPTRECLVEALESFEDFDTGIQAPVTFGPERRMGVDTVGVAQIQDGAVVVLKGFDE